MVVWSRAKLIQAKRPLGVASVFLSNSHRGKPITGTHTESKSNHPHVDGYLPESAEGRSVLLRHCRQINDRIYKIIHTLNISSVNVEV